MKAVPLAFRGVLLGLLSSSLHAQDPVLATPGTATWQDQSIPTGTRTQFTLTDNTVLNWNRLLLGSGDELDFNFVGNGGDSVLNVLTGGRTHIIAGNVTSNGNVGFVSPNARLIVTGDITANDVTLSTLNVDPVDFANGGSTSFQGGAGKSLTVGGNISATSGDVHLVGASIFIQDSGQITAQAGAIRIGSGDGSVDIDSSGTTRVQTSGSGNALIAGVTRADVIEVNSSEVANRSDMGNVNGTSQIFFEVGTNGRISNEGGVIVGNINSSAPITGGLAVDPNEADNAQIVSESNLKLPKLTRPNGTKVASNRTVTTSSPMSASSNSSRQTRSTTRSVARNDRSKSLMTRGGFFGARGGGQKVASR
ncbi:MAG: hypothetical protein AAGI48_14910 [Verrucomicrobiota bacterium]